MSVWDDLAAPFEEVKLRPLEVRTIDGWKKAKKQNGKYREPVKAKFAAYIDARDVQDRFDAVLGPDCWQDSYTPLPDGSMICDLAVRVENGEWLHKQGIGYPNDENDDEPFKGAESDALKRAAVKWRCGRYLYSLRTVNGIDLDAWHELDSSGQLLRPKSSKKPQSRYEQLKTAIKKHNTATAVYALLCAWGVIESADEWAKLSESDKRRKIDGITEDAWPDLLAIAEDRT